MRKIMALTTFILLGGMLLADTPELLSGPEKSQLLEMLDSAGLEENSLRFEKDWDLSTKFKLDWQLRQLQDPWQAMADLAELRSLCAMSDSLNPSWPTLTRKLGQIAFQRAGADFPGEGYGVYPAARQDFDKQVSQQVRQPKDLFAFLEKNLASCQRDLDKVLAGFSQGQLDSLASFWMWQFIESEDVDRYKDIYRTKSYPPYDSLDAEKVYALFERLDLAALLDAGIRFQALADAVAGRAAELKFNNKKPLVKETAWGLMVLGTPQDDRYNSKTLGGKQVCLLIEPGGNDLYETSLYTDSHRNFYLLADLAGDDVYRYDEPAAMFCSAFGYGYSIDRSGNDLYQTGDFGFSAFVGMNLHHDVSGDDIYHGGLFCQGAAMFGTSLLIDGAGNDSYQASVSSQGLGSTHGVGAILDQSGVDTYTLGGKYFHEPLMPLDYITLGQGMGLGLRPDLAGGLGLIYDRSGNDRYLGGVYAQGSGYWYATGALLDEAGNDVYNTVYYPQGSGIHLACGFLLDGGGDDAYYSRHGPGQGAGHDWALGMLIDEAGNDAYSIQGGGGLGLTNSVGIFIDKSGDDRYERDEGQNFGNANFSRGTGGIGLFLDAGGKDVYPDSLQANDKTWQKGTYGIGLDVALNLVEKSAIEELAEAAALPDSTDSIEDIFAAASEWEVGSAVHRVRVAREILLARAEEAIPYVLENKMATDSGLEYRALEILAKQSRPFVERLYPLIEAADSLAAKNAMSLIAGVGDSLLVSYVERLLRENKYVTACLSVLAALPSQSSVDLLRGYIFHPSERFRYITARSLSTMKHPAAKPALQLMEDDKSFLVQALLRNLPPEARP